MDGGCLKLVAPGGSKGLRGLFDVNSPVASQELGLWFVDLSWRREDGFRHGHLASLPRGSSDAPGRKGLTCSDWES